jgi:arylsulfatase A-like enzyme
VFWEFDFRTPNTQVNERALGLTSDQCTLNVIRDRKYKYVHFTMGPPLLYDLRADPGELASIAERPGSEGAIAHYARRLLSHRMLHASRTLANVTLTAEGAVPYRGTRGLLPELAS